MAENVNPYQSPETPAEPPSKLSSLEAKVRFAGVCCMTGVIATLMMIAYIIYDFSDGHAKGGRFWRFPLGVGAFVAVAGGLWWAVLQPFRSRERRSQ